MQSHPRLPPLRVVNFCVFAKFGNGNVFCACGKTNSLDMFGNEKDFWFEQIPCLLEFFTQKCTSNDFGRSANDFVILYTEKEWKKLERLDTVCLS